MMNYTVRESRYGLFISVAPDGTEMITAMTEEACRYATDNIHIPVIFGEFDGYTSKQHSSVVDGKL